MRDLSGARVVVMGLGRFGGGLGVTRWLVEHDASVHVTDLETADRLATPLASLADLLDRGVVTTRLGGHDEADFTSADILVVNPAVPQPWSNRFVRAARDAGVAVTTEIRLLTQRLDRRRVIGVTGSAGKSTTASMIHHVMSRLAAESDAGQVYLGGNIGGSLLSHVHLVNANDWVVIELSSAMLHWLNDEPPGWSPHIAVLTNIEPNHLDWHGSEEHYRRCKELIFAGQQAGDHAITSAILRDDTPDVPMPLAGRHNQHNGQLAFAAACAATGVAPERAASMLADFKGLRDRLEVVGDVRGVRCINDSKSTTPSSTRLAVEAIGDPARVHLIAGGHDKKIDLSSIAEMARDLAGLYTIGTTGEHLVGLASPGASASYCRTLEHAVEHAMSRARAGDTLLLSPGCASWDQYDNFEARGDEFKEVLSRLA